MGHQGVVLDYSGALSFFRREEMVMLAPRVEAIHRQIAAKQGAGNDFLGWVDLPVNADQAEIEAVKAAAARIRENSEVLVVAGIGGSYLGARAALEMLMPYFRTTPPQAGNPEVIFVGHHLSGAYLEQLKLHQRQRIQYQRDLEIRDHHGDGGGLPLPEAISGGEIR